MLDATGIFAAVTSHAMASGHFDRVTNHEPKSAPGTGLTCAVWVQDIRPIRSSGLASTSARLVLNLRIFTSMLSEPQDEIDPDMLAAVDALMAAYIGDFELGGLIRAVDVRGMEGVPLSASAGYLNQDGKLQRVITITLPLLVNDLYVEVA
jgi:hypothetical protein